VGASSRESTASSHRAHLQRIPRASSYADEPSSQEPKLGRTDRLAAPGRTPPWMVAWLPPPPVPSPQGLHHGHSGRSWPKRSVLPRPGGQGGDGGDFGRIQVVPEDPLRPSGAAAADDLLTGTIRSRRKSWAVSGSASASTCRGCIVVATTVSGPIRPASTSNANSRSEKPPPYPPWGPRGSRPRCRRPPGPWVAARPTPIRRPRAPSRDRGGAPRWDLEPRRVEDDEGTLVGRAGHSHVQELAVSQGACPDRELGASGLA
jgi:hypothetical protein